MTEPYFRDDSVTLYHGDAHRIAEALPADSVDCIVTSPPYWGLRDYGAEGQYGSEDYLDEYVETLQLLFDELARVLVPTGTAWLNLGDTYGPGKCLQGVPWRVALALADYGWSIRSEIVWEKPNAMPESATDRPSRRHETVFLLARERSYYYDGASVRERYTGDRAASRRVRSGQVTKENSIARAWTPSDDTRPCGTVWPIPTQPFPGAHFATMPLALAERCVRAGCPPEGVVLDPFSGSGTTGLAAARHGRRYVGIDLNADYLDLSLRTRLSEPTLIEGASA